MFKKLISLALTLSFGLQQTVFAYTASLNLSGYLNQGPNLTVSDKFRPINLRYFSYQPKTNDFQILLDKGDYQEPSLHLRGAGRVDVLKREAGILLDYFKIGLSLPNDKFWVNLRPDSQDEIIDEELAKTDLGKVMLEADLKLKQDTALFTSPQTPQGKEYWNKLYQKAGELFGTENITIPTLTRPWIVPGEIILRESSDNNSKTSQGAYIYKANLKVMLEEDYLTSSGGSRTAPTSDPRLKELNQYSTQLIRELILPKLTQKVNSSKDYANLRQVYFSLILARWFKETFKGRFSESSGLLKRTVPDIDSGDLTNLTSKQAWDKTTYFQAYQKSFQEGEYSLSEPVYTPTGQVIRRYMSGGIKIMSGSPLEGGGKFLGNIKELPSIFKKLAGINFESHAWSEISGETSQPQTEVSKAAGSPLSLEVIKLQMKTIIEKEQLAEQLAKKRIPQIDDNPSYHGLNMIAAGIKQTRNTNEDISNWENIQKWLIQMVRYESEINRFMSTYKRKELLEPFEKREMDGYFTRNDLISAANKLSSIAQNTLHDVELGFRFIRLSEEIRAFVLKGTAADGTKSALQELEGVDVKNKALGRKPSALPLGIRDNFLVVANTISLPEGSRTGRTNIGNASLLDGIIANHPEWRKEIEERIYEMV